MIRAELQVNAAIRQMFVLVAFLQQNTMIRRRPCLIVFLVCLGVYFVGQIFSFKIFFKKSFMLFNLSDVWRNPNVFNFTVSFTRHSAGLHRCDTDVRWPSLGYFELRATDQLSPGAPVWPPGPHIACEAAHGHQTQRDAIIWLLLENVSCLNPAHCVLKCIIAHLSPTVQFIHVADWIMA